MMDGVPVNVRRSVYDELSLVAECVFALPDALSDAAQLRKDRIQEDLKARLLKMQPDPGELFEEYAILLIATVDGAPDAFIDRNGAGPGALPPFAARRVRRRRNSEHVDVAGALFRKRNDRGRLGRRGRHRPRE